MAFSAHKDAELMEEICDPDDVLEEKLDRLASMIKEYKKILIFTGAGISTSAGISDFRGPKGVWTLQAQGKKPVRSQPTISAIPTTTHMSIVTLQNQGYLKYLISQNCDGLHRRSGMRADMMSELHGNGNIEECETCSTRYFRDYPAHRLSRGRDHFTGRFCSKGDCRGRLLEWTVDFGQNLPEDQLERAMVNSNSKTLHLVLGSSLTVSPANSMPKTTKKRGGKLVICNLQKTPYYDLADMNIRAPCDRVMKGICDRLNLEIEEWVLRRKMIVSTKFKRNLSGQITAIQLAIGAVDPHNDNVPASVFSRIEVQLTANGEFQELSSDWIPVNDELLRSKRIHCVRLQFMMHYNEPHLNFQYPLNFEDEASIRKFFLIFHPITTKKWEVQPIDDQTELPILSSLTTSPVTKISTKPTENLDSPDIGMWSAGVYCKDRSSFYVFGGTNANDVSVLNTNSFKWDQLVGPRDAPDFFPCINGKRRWGHTATYLAKTAEVILIGGWDNTSQYMDVYSYDLNTSTMRQIEVPKGDRPDCRAGHSALLINSHQIIVYGGAVCRGGPYHYFNDVWVFNLDTNEWMEYQYTGLGQVPLPSSQHSATLLWNRFMLVVGGCDASFLKNDIFCLDLQLHQWHRVEVSGDFPHPKAYKQTDFRVEAAKNCAVKLSSDLVLLIGFLGGNYLLDAREMKCTKVPGDLSNIFPTAGAIIDDGNLLVLGYDMKKRCNQSLLINYSSNM